MSERILMHTVRMPIRWGDMDAMGHVNNTVYFRYFEQARLAWFEQIDCVPDLAYGQGVVIINTHCTFLRPLKYPGEIEIRTFAASPGRSSVETMHEIRRVDAPDVLAAEGGAKVVWIDYQLEKSLPIPEHVRLRFQQPAQ